MKKIFLPFVIFFLLPSVMQAATGVTQLEGSFKVGPAIILITILILFVLVGIFFRAKDTTDFMLPAVEYPKLVREWPLHPTG